MKFLICVFILIATTTSFAKTDLSSPEYRKVNDILSLDSYKITISDIDKVMTYALMETDRVWETNIFGQIRHGIKNSEAKYAVIRYLAEQFTDIFFHSDDVFSYKGQHFSITKNTRLLALEAFWDIAENKLETKHVFDIMETHMFDVTLMALSENQQETKVAQRFLEHSYKYLKSNMNNPHLDLFVLGIKNHLFNIYTGSQNAEVRSAAYEIISSVIKRGPKAKLISTEFKNTLIDLSKTFSFSSCRTMWN